MTNGTAKNAAKIPFEVPNAAEAQHSMNIGRLSQPHGWFLLLPHNFLPVLHPDKQKERCRLSPQEQAWEPVRLQMMSGPGEWQQRLQKRPLPLLCRDQSDEADMKGRDIRGKLHIVPTIAN